MIASVLDASCWTIGVIFDSFVLLGFGAVSGVGAGLAESYRCC